MGRDINAKEDQWKYRPHDFANAIAFPFTGAALFIMAVVEIILELTRFLMGRSQARLKHLRPGVSGELKMDVFDPTSLLPADWKRIQHEYIDRGIPFVVRRKDGKPLTESKPPAAFTREEFTPGEIRVSAAPYFQSFGYLDNVIGKLFPTTFRAYWPLWFLGNYSQGLAHSDSGPTTCNAYYMQKGEKDIIIVPTEVTRRVKLQTGLDGLYIKGSETDTRGYLSSLPYYYHVDLKEGSLMVFNNSTCIHQFKNVIGKDGSPPQALSTRIFHSVGADRRTWWNLCFNTKLWWRFAGVASAQFIGEKTENRDAKYL